jgi:hypothetical protein
MKVSARPLLLVLFSLLPFSSSAEVFMTESFESGDLVNSNTQGFKWAGPNNTSVIEGVSRPGSQGDQALKFHYAAGQFMSEQRFDLGMPYRELWLRYWLKVPENFEHSKTQPSNNKLLALWMDDYSSKGDGPSVVWEFWSDGKGGSQLAVHYSAGKYTITGSHLQHKPFISYPSDQGRWMQILVHVKEASSRGANDGVIETYRRWQDEASFTLLHRLTDADIASPPAGPDGWRAGYLMGWSNPGYAKTTEWIVDDVEFSNKEFPGMPSRPMPPGRKD